MTDEQIVKDLECYIDEADGFYATDVLKNALDLLKRQNATIEQLEKDKESFANSYAKAVARNLTIKAEAVKEFVYEILSPYAGKAYLNKRDLEIIVENLAKYY